MNEPGFGEAPAADRLQELLSRAVEDQVSEQRALYGMLDELKAALAMVPALSPAEMRAVFDRSLGAATTRWEAESRASGAAVTARVDQLAARLDPLASRLDQIESTLGGQLAGTTQQLGTGLGELVGRLGQVQDRLTDLGEQVVDVAASRGPGAPDGAVADAVDALRAGLAEFSGHVSVSLAEISGQLEANRQGLLAQSEATVAHLDALPALTAQVGALESGVADRMRDLAQRLDSSLDGLGEVLMHVRAALAGGGGGGGEQAIAGVRAELAVLSSRLEAMTASIETGSQASAGLSGEISEGVAGVVREGVRDAVRDFVRDTLRDAVREVVTVTTRDTERRLAAHVDEAVLTLAQALLRRRAVGPAALSPAPLSPAPLSPASVSPAPPESAAPVAPALPDEPTSPPRFDPPLAPPPAATLEDRPAGGWLFPEQQSATDPDSAPDPAAAPEPENWTEPDPSGLFAEPADAALAGPGPGDPLEEEPPTGVMTALSADPAPPEDVPDSGRDPEPDGQSGASGRSHPGYDPPPLPPAPPSPPVQHRGSTSRPKRGLFRRG